MPPSEEHNVQIYKSLSRVFSCNYATSEKVYVHKSCLALFSVHDTVTSSCPYHEHPLVTFFLKCVGHMAGQEKAMLSLQNSLQAIITIILSFCHDNIFNEAVHVLFG